MYYPKDAASAEQGYFPISHNQRGRDSSTCLNTINTNILTDEYSSAIGLGWVDDDYVGNLSSKKSTDGKTIFWYAEDLPSDQFNEENCIYSFSAFK